MTSVCPRKRNDVGLGAEVGSRCRRTAGCTKENVRGKRKPDRPAADVEIADKETVFENEFGPAAQHGSSVETPHKADSLLLIGARVGESAGSVKGAVCHAFPPTVSGWDALCSSKAAA